MVQCLLLYINTSVVAEAFIPGTAKMTSSSVIGCVGGHAYFTTVAIVCRESH